MPELPEVETATQCIKPYALNKKIKEVIIREKKLREPIPGDLLNLGGVTIIDTFSKSEQETLAQFGRG